MISLCLCLAGCITIPDWLPDFGGDDNDGDDPPADTGGHDVSTVGDAVALGPAGIKPSLALDSQGRPHVAVLRWDGSGDWIIYDKADTWSATEFRLSAHWSPAGSLNNPHVEVDTKTDRVWMSGVMVVIGNYNGCGIGVVSYQPGQAIEFQRRQMVAPPAWATGNLSVDPVSGRAIVWVNDGRWERLVYSDGIKKTASGVSLFPLNLGERPTGTFRVARQAGESRVWHAAFGGHPNLPGLRYSGYQNSRRYDSGQPCVPWVDSAVYRGTDEDNYVGLGVDLENSEAAYLAIDSHDAQGILVNVWNGTNMVYPVGAPLAFPGSVGQLRWSPQWASAPGGGAWICYNNAGNVTVRHVAQDGSSSGEPIAVCAGTHATIACDTRGRLHLVYMAGGQTRYRVVVTE
jgi:hypothetical protein